MFGFFQRCEHLDHFLLEHAYALFQGRVAGMEFRWEWSVVAAAGEIRVRLVAVVRIDTPLADIGEERAERVVVLGGDRVELVIVTLGAAGGEAEPCAAERADPVAHVFRHVFGRLGTAFAGHQVEAQEAGGDSLFFGGVRQQVSGKLFARELVEALVVVERPDHIIAVGENPGVLIAVVADRIRKTSDIEP